MSRLLLFLLPCALLISSCEKAEETKPADENGAPQGQQGQQGRQGDHQNREGIFQETTAEIVDMKKAMAENPNLKIFERQGLGNDPLSQYTNAFAYSRSQPQTLSMKNELRIMKELNEGRNLTYEQFMDFVKNHNYEFVMLKPWQKYGYDEENGQMVILQDEAEKKRRYQEAGIEDQYQEGTL